MIKSMTAYGRASQSIKMGQWVLEVHCVNRKMLDINMYAPKELLRFDVEMRKWISSFISRGQITVRLHLLEEDEIKHFLEMRKGVFKEIKEGWERIARDLGYDSKKEINMNFLADQFAGLPVKTSITDETEFLPLLKELFHTAMGQVIEMKEKEGQALQKDLELRLDNLEALFEKISSLSQETVEKYRKKLLDRIQEVCQVEGECEERIVREVAIYAEKVDITEELIRLESHLVQFRGFFHSKEKSIGRTLDFLSQEMNREINTIASKSVEREISPLIVTAKSELEKIREQIQNIE